MSRKPSFGNLVQLSLAKKMNINTARNCPILFRFTTYLGAVFSNIQYCSSEVVVNQLINSSTFFTAEFN